MRNAVVWATHEEAPVTVTGPGVLDVTLWRQKSSLTVHLVNLTNPMMMKGPIREFIPVGEQKMRVKLPSATPPREVKFLVSGKPAASHQTGAWLEVTVPSILDHEVLAVDFG